MEFTHKYITELVQDFAENCDAVNKKGYRKIINALNSGEQMAGYVKEWYNAKEREEITKDDGEKTYITKYAHATDITKLRTSRTIVNDYYKAFCTAIDGSENDFDEAYKTIHFTLLDTLNDYFDKVFLSCIEEQYGEDFIKFYSAKVEADDTFAALEEAKSEVRGCKQSLSRLQRPKKGEPDAFKVEQAKQNLEAANTNLENATNAYNAAKETYTALLAE
ncbi:MAG: hypothetical protein U0L71_03490 [Eggerthellaceae bacterium]|nr:hypothetical protein [Eggerthellaceae bacterium]